MINYEKLKPMPGKLLVRRSKPDDKTEGGIYLPESQKEKAQTGEVCAIQIMHEDNDHKSYINIGDTVYFAKYAGTEMNNDYLILREEDILGIIEK